MKFIYADNLVLNRDCITYIDVSRIQDLEATIAHENGVVTVYGIQAIEAVMALKPSALEGRRLRWAKRAWALHNLVGHPAMQLLSFLRLYKCAMWIHDITVPTPKK
jgi:hypothetical protein